MRSKNQLLLLIFILALLTQACEYKSFNPSSMGINTKSCLVPNGEGEQTQQGLNWSECITKACLSGYHLQNETCVSDTQSCAANNGFGIQTWNGSSWSNCQVKRCADANFHIESNTCVANSKGCEIANGSGISNWTRF